MPLSSSSLAAIPWAHPSPAECRPCQVSCSSPCLSVFWFADLSEAAHRLADHGLRPSALAGAELKLGQFRQEISDIFPAVNNNESLEESALGSASSSLPRVF